MKGTVLIFRPGEDAQPEITEWTGDPSEYIGGSPRFLKMLQDAVDGYIEAVPGFDHIRIGDEVARCVAFCNEHGKLEQLPLNREATRRWHEALPPPGLLRPDGGLADTLCGSIAVVIGDAEFMAAL